MCFYYGTMRFCLVQCALFCIPFYGRDIKELKKIQRAARISRVAGSGVLIIEDRSEKELIYASKTEIGDMAEL